MIWQPLKIVSEYTEAFGKIFAVVAGLYWAMVWLQERDERQSAAMTGVWGNEGNIGKPVSNYHAELSLSVVGRRISGTVRCFGPEAGSIAYVELTGWRLGTRLRVRAFIIRHGEVIPQGTVKMRISRKALLLTPTFSSRQWLPGPVVLWKKQVQSS